MILPNSYLLPLQSEIIVNIQRYTNLAVLNAIFFSTSNCYTLTIVLCLLLLHIVATKPFKFQLWATSTWLLTSKKRLTTSSKIYKPGHNHMLTILSAVYVFCLISLINRKSCLTFSCTTPFLSSPQNHISII